MPARRHCAVTEDLLNPAGWLLRRLERRRFISCWDCLRKRTGVLGIADLAHKVLQTWKSHAKSKSRA